MHRILCLPILVVIGCAHSGSLQGTSWLGSYRASSRGTNAQIYFNFDSALGSGPVSLDHVAQQVSWLQLGNGWWQGKNLKPVIGGYCRLNDQYGNIVGEARGDASGLRVSAYGREIFLTSGKLREAFDAATPGPDGRRDVQFDFGSPGLAYVLQFVVDDPDAAKLPSPGLVIAFAAIQQTVVR